MLKVFDISAYHFYKLIEVCIKLEGFPRGIMKHLSRVRREGGREREGGGGREGGKEREMKEVGGEMEGGMS